MKISALILAVWMCVACTAQVPTNGTQVNTILQDTDPMGNCITYNQLVVNSLTGNMTQCVNSSPKTTAYGVWTPVNTSSASNLAPFSLSGNPTGATGPSKSLNTAGALRIPANGIPVLRDVINVRDGATFAGVRVNMLTSGIVSAGATIIPTNGAPAASTFSPGQGIFIQGAGASGTDYVGTVVLVVGANITVTPATGTMVSSGTYVDHDDTAVIESMRDMCEAVGTVAGTYPILHFPWGVINISHQITHKSCGWRGESISPTSTFLFWNGPTTGGMLYIPPESAGYAGNGSAKEISGFRMVAGLRSPTNFIVADAYIDEFGKFDNNQFGGSSDAAILLNQGVANLHWTGQRWDGCGGGIHVIFSGTQYLSSFSVRDFTFAGAGAFAPKYFIWFDSPNGAVFPALASVADARIEINSNGWDPTGAKSLFKFTESSPFVMGLSLDNIAYQNQNPSTGDSVIYNGTGQSNWSAALHITNSAFKDMQYFVSPAGSTFANGMNLTFSPTGPNSIELLSWASGTSTNSFYGAPITSSEYDSTGIAFQAFVKGEAMPRWQAQADGSQNFGLGGNSAPDSGFNRCGLVTFCFGNATAGDFSGILKAAQFQGLAASATTATQLNGGAVPASAACLGTNSSRQLITASCSGTGGSGTPAGSTGQPQINTGGTFDAVAQTQYVNTASPNGIANAITACGTTVSCSIIVPPSYATAEVLPGFSLDPNNFNYTGSYSQMPSNILLQDQRQGRRMYATNNLGYCQGTTCATLPWQFNLYSPATAGVPILSALSLTQNSWDGGTNLQLAGGSGYTNKTTYNTASFNLNSMTPGQHIGLTSNMQCFSIGDCLGLNTQVRASGGYNASADEGAQTGDNRVFQDNVQPTGTVGGSPATGATSLTLNFSTGVGHQGAGRWIIKTNAGVITTGTVSAISTASGSPTTLTGTSTSWPVSTVVAQLGTAVNGPGSVTVTPASYTTGSISGITTSTLVCVADYSNFEMVYPSAVSGSTFTATFSKPHVASASIGVGGLCGYLMDLTADEATAAVFPNTNNESVQGTLRWAWPVMYSTSATSAVTWVSGAGGYRQLVSRWNATSANGYKLFPFAEVTSVQQAGGPSNVFTLGPNKVTWANSDTWEELHYPAIHISPGFNIYQSYFPCFVDAACGGGLTYNMPLHDNDTMFSLLNNNLASQYFNPLSGSNQGKYYPPYGLRVDGPVRSGLQVTTPGPDGAVVIGCPYYDSSCTTAYKVLRASNSTLFDSIVYDPVNKRWGAQYNNGASTCWLDTTCGGSGSSSSLGAGIGTQPVFGGSNVQVNVKMLPRSVTGTSDTVAAADCGGLVTYNNTGAVTVALPQAGLGGNFSYANGCVLYFTNYGTGAVTITASTSLIGPSVSARIIPAASGSGSSLVTHSLSLTPDASNNYQIVSAN